MNFDINVTNYVIYFYDQLNNNTREQFTRKVQVNNASNYVLLILICQTQTKIYLGYVSFLEIQREHYIHDFFLKY